MTKVASGNSSSVLWRGRPWIVPGLIARSILVVAIAVVVFWLEFQFNVTGYSLFLSLPLWTGLMIFLIWFLSIGHLLSLRVSNAYILRSDGLEVRTGLISSKSFVIAPAGFSDLEVVRSISERIVNSGRILIRTQGETDIKMHGVRNALRVSEQIREVMARPIVRIVEQNVPAEEK